jgi:hypothetical protein
MSFLKTTQLVLVVLMVQITSITFAQIWEKETDKNYSDILNSSVQTDDGSFISVGSTNLSSNSLSDILIVKTSSLGDTLWTKVYGTDETDAASNIIKTLDNNYLVTGKWGTDVNNSDIIILKIDNNGDTLWTKKFGGPYEDEGRKSIEDSLGNFYVLGSKTATTSYVMYTIKTNPSGDTIWTRIYAKPYSAFPNSIIRIPGGVVASGYYYANDMGKGQTSFLINYGFKGDTLWEKDYVLNGIPENYISDLSYSPDHGYLLACSTYYASIGYQFTLMKTDTKGDTLWTKNYTFNNSDYFMNSIDTTSDHSYILCGYKVDGSINKSLSLIKVSSSGDTLWTRRYGITNNCYGMEAKETSDQGFIVSGVVSNLAGGNSEDMYLIKTDKNGKAYIISSIFPVRTYTWFLKNYPNPANDKTAFYFDQPTSQNYWITVRDEQGIIQLKKNISSFESSYEIETASLNNGIYLYEIFSETLDQVCTGKLVVIH